MGSVIAHPSKFVISLVLYTMRDALTDNPRPYEEFEPTHHLAERRLLRRMPTLGIAARAADDPADRARDYRLVIEGRYSDCHRCGSAGFIIIIGVWRVGDRPFREAVCTASVQKNFHHRYSPWLAHPEKNMGMISNRASHSQPAFWKHYSDFIFVKRLISFALLQEGNSSSAYNSSWTM
jgi:hypothetical protein